MVVLVGRAEASRVRRQGQPDRFVYEASRRRGAEWHERDPVEVEHIAVRALRLVEDAGFRVALAGGWSRELLGLEAPRQHSDIDLVLTDADVAELDTWLSTQDEIEAKRFPHKRAFRLDGVMVELHLVRRITD